MKKTDDMAWYRRQADNLARVGLLLFVVGFWLRDASGGVGLKLLASGLLASAGVWCAAALALLVVGALVTLVPPTRWEVDRFVREQRRLASRGGEVRSRWGGKGDHTSLN